MAIRVNDGEHFEERNTHWRFYLMAEEEIARMDDAMKQISAARKMRVDGRGRHLMKLHTNFTAFAKAVQKVKLFTALSAEAFINHFLFRHYGSDGFIAQQLEKIPMPMKWYVLPRLTVGQGFDEKDVILKQLNELNTERNTMVHPKTKMTPIDGDRERLIDRAWAKKHFANLQRAILKLSDLDPEFEDNVINLYIKRTPTKAKRLGPAS